MELFTRDEVEEIRNQYETRLTQERMQREELEWMVKMELSTLREAETSLRKAAQVVANARQVLSVVATHAESQPAIRAPIPKAAKRPRKSPPPIPSDRPHLRALTPLPAKLAV